MERKSLSDMLVKVREEQKCGKNELCRRTGFTFNQLQRIENATNSYNMTIPIKYLCVLQSYLVLRINKKEYSVESYSDLVKCLKKARGKQLSQWGLAACANISYTYFANVESEKTIVGVDNFLKLAEILSIDIAIESSNQLTNE